MDGMTRRKILGGFIAWLVRSWHQWFSIRNYLEDKLEEENGKSSTGTRKTDE